MNISKHFQTVLESLKKVEVKQPETQKKDELNKDDTQEVTYSIDTSGPAAKVDDTVKVVKKGASIPKEKFEKCCEGIIGHFERQLTLTRLAGLQDKISPIQKRLNEMHGMRTKYCEEEEIRFEPPQNLPATNDAGLDPEGLPDPALSADSTATDVPVQGLPDVDAKPDIDIGQVIADVINMMRDEPTMRAVDAFAAVLAQCAVGCEDEVDPLAQDSIDAEASIEPGPATGPEGDITLDIRPQ